MDSCQGLELRTVSTHHVVFYEEMEQLMIVAKHTNNVRTEIYFVKSILLINKFLSKLLE